MGWWNMKQLLNWQFQVLIFLPSAVQNRAICQKYSGSRNGLTLPELSCFSYGLQVVTQHHADRVILQRYLEHCCLVSHFSVSVTLLASQDSQQLVELGTAYHYLPLQFSLHPLWVQPQRSHLCESFSLENQFPSGKGLHWERTAKISQDKQSSGLVFQRVAWYSG